MMAELIKLLKCCLIAILANFFWPFWKMSCCTKEMPWCSHYRVSPPVATAHFDCAYAALDLHGCFHMLCYRLVVATRESTD